MYGVWRWRRTLLSAFAQGGGDGGGRKCRSASRPKMARDNTAWQNNIRPRWLVVVVVAAAAMLSSSSLVGSGSASRSMEYGVVRSSWSWTTT